MTDSTDDRRERDPDDGGVDDRAEPGDREPDGGAAAAVREGELPAASRDATTELAAQRGRHESDDDDLDEEGIGALVVNTGLDGDAASG